MKTYYKVILFLSIACIVHNRTDAQIYVSGVLTANTTWSRNQNPFIVTEDIIIPAGITLTIQSGVVVKFQVETSIKVYGTLVAKGTEVDHILFTGNLPGPDIVRWSGIKLYKTITQRDANDNYLSGTIISHSRFEGTTYSLSITDSSSVLIEKCEIDNSSFGIYLQNSNNNIIRDCSISHTNFGIFIPAYDSSCNNRFINNRLIENLNVGFFMNNNKGKARRNIIEGNLFKDNPMGLYIGNDGPMDAGNNIIRNNTVVNSSVNGLRLYQDSTIVSGNIFCNNSTGIEMLNTKNSIILNNMIYQSQDYGIVLSGISRYDTIEGNNIYNNKQGVLITAKNGDSALFNSFQTNSVHDNQVGSFLIEASPQGGIQYNNIYNNGTQDCFVNRTGNVIHAENNWWGTTDTILINRQIFDVFDDNHIGQVIYKPYSGLPSTAAPISAPRNVVKQLINGKVEISWSPNPESDLKGYRVYYNFRNFYTFANNIDVHRATHQTLIGVSILDTLAVTAYDNQADGINDQVEGHESAYAYAVLSPYAGADTSICYNNSFQLTDATAFNYSSLLWSTSGDGSFNNPIALHPIYTPGVQDKASGLVKLTITAIYGTLQISDEVQISLLTLPFVTVGPDGSVLQDSSFALMGSNAKYYDSLHWASLGDGQFDNPSVLHSNYTPGASDISLGMVSLYLKATSICGAVTDTLSLVVVPSFSISGKVHAGNLLISKGTLTLLQKNGTSFEHMRSGQVLADGTFRIGSLTRNTYLIYAFPDQNEYPDYLPTYYAGELSWKDAYLLPLQANTFDVDVYLVPRSFALPVGVGSISGLCSTGGDDVPNAEVQNLTILLMDGQGKNILGYTRTNADGSFSFSNLPYGSYLLKGEKAGYEPAISPLINIVPGNAIISGIQIRLVSYKIIFAYITQPGIKVAAINIYPNPASDILHLELPEINNFSGFSLVDAIGRMVSGFAVRWDVGSKSSFEFNIKTLTPGYYYLIIYNDQDFRERIGFLKL